MAKARRVVPTLAQPDGDLPAYKTPRHAPRQLKPQVKGAYAFAYRPRTPAERCLLGRETRCYRRTPVNNGEDPTIRRRQNREAMNERDAEAWRRHCQVGEPGR